MKLLSLIFLLISTEIRREGPSPPLISFSVACMGEKLSKSRSGKMSKDANQVVISASGKHTATLIFLHGLGDTGHGWASTLAEVRPHNLKIVCPTAPTVPVTLNSGEKDQKLLY